MPDEDNTLLCRQLLQIVAKIRSGAHVESSNVSINRGGTLTIYSVVVSLEDPYEPSWDAARPEGYSQFEYVPMPDGTTTTVPKETVDDEGPVIITEDDLLGLIREQERRERGQPQQ